MSIKQTTPTQAVNEYLDQQIKRRVSAVLNLFEYLGMSCIAEARNEGSYHDVTGSLRASVGYIIVQDGIIHSISAFGAGAGAAIGIEYAKSLAYMFPHGIVLIVVAGMNYAAVVESRGMNVLTSAELLAEQQVPILMKKLGFTT